MATPALSFPAPGYGGLTGVRVLCVCCETAAVSVGPLFQHSHVCVQVHSPSLLSQTLEPTESRSLTLQKLQNLRTRNLFLSHQTTSCFMNTGDVHVPLYHEEGRLLLQGSHKEHA